MCVCVCVCEREREREGEREREREREREIYIHNVCTHDRTLYLLGYIPRDNRVYLGDKELNVVSYSLQLSVLEYQTAIMRKDFDTADKVCCT